MKRYSVLILGILIFLGSAVRAQKSVTGNGVMATKVVEIGNIVVEGWIQNANAKSVGSGNIVLGTVETLRYDLVGSGNVEYVDDNANVDGFSAGSGRIVKR